MVHARQPLWPFFFRFAPAGSTAESDERARNETATSPDRAAYLLPLAPRVLAAAAVAILVLGCGPVGQPPSEKESAIRRVRFALDQDVWAWAASRDGKMLATVDARHPEQRKVCLRDLTTGRELSSDATADGMPRFATFAPDGRRLAVEYDTRRLDRAPFRIQLWDVTADGELTNARTLEPDAEYSSRTVHAVSFSPDGNSVVAGTAEEVLYLWDAATGRVKRRFQGGVAAGFAPDGRTLTAVTHDGEVRRFETASWKYLGPAEPVKRTDFLFVTHAIFAPDGKRVALGDDWTTLVKDVASNQTVCRLHLLTGGVPLCFSPDSRTLVVVGDGAAQFFDPATGAERAWLRGADGFGQFLGDGRYLACEDGRSVTLRETDTFLAGRAPASPATDPPDAPLQAELIARQDTYTLDLEGDTPEDFSARIPFAERFPEGPQVDLLIRLRNTGNENITLRDPRGWWVLSLAGPGALYHAEEARQTGVVSGPDGAGSERPGPVTLAPGESHTIPIAELNPEGFAFWILPGEYRIAGTYWAGVAPVPKGAGRVDDGFADVAVRLAPIEVKVLPPDKPGVAPRRLEGPPPPGTVVVPKPDDGSGKTRERLAKAITFPGVDAGTPLEDVLGWLNDRYDLDVRIDQAAFKNAGDPRIGQKQIGCPRLVNVSLHTALDVLLDQVDGRLEVRGSTVWVVPPDRPCSLAERLPPARRRFRQQLDEPITLAAGIKAGTSLSVALDLLRDESDVQFVLDTTSFERAGVTDIEKRPIRLEPRTKVPLRGVLDDLAQQVGGRYVLRDRLVLLLPRDR